MAKKIGLGRGLDALLEDKELLNDYEKPEKTSKDTAGQELFLNPELLIPNPHQPRKEFDEEALKELSQSIKEHGIIQPVLVEKNDDNSYYIIAGERRTRAAKLAGLKEIPVIVKKYSSEKKLEIALIENIQREDLNPIEEAQAYHELMLIGNLTQEELAKRVGKNRSTVANALRLLKLPDNINNALVSGTISAGHARTILSVLNPSDQIILFNKIIESNLSVRQTEQLAQELNEGSRASTNKKQKSKDFSKQETVKDANLLELEQKFIEALGTKVSIKGNLEKGNIEIAYFSKDDLDNLYQIIIKEN